MIDRIFNRTIFLWAGAIILACFLVKPHAALIQRINTMNMSYIDCVDEGNCENPRAITEAREYYRILAALYPDYGRGCEMQGIAYLQLKRDKMAIKKFQEAIKHNPDLFWVSFELGKAFYRQGNYAQSLGYFKGIIAEDNVALLKKSTLSPLRHLSDKIREQLILSLVDFVSEIKLQSYQMAIGCLVHQGQFDKAKGIILQGMNNQQFLQEDFFKMASGSLDQDKLRLEMMSWIDAIARQRPVLHPWGHIIQPMKEILYQ